MDKDKRVKSHFPMWHLCEHDEREGGGEGERRRGRRRVMPGAGKHQLKFFQKQFNFRAESWFPSRLIESPFFFFRFKVSYCTQNFYKYFFVEK